MPRPDLRPPKPLDLVQGQWPHAVSAKADIPTEHGGGTAGRAAEQIARIVTDIQIRMREWSWNQRTLADRSGVGAGTLSALMNGNSWPDSWTLTRLAAALGADLEFIPRGSETVRLRDYLAAQRTDAEEQRRSAPWQATGGASQRR